MVSVIVPAYNAEKTIKKCLQSLLDQDYQDIEILVINDGSLDSTGEICKGYADKYEKISLWEQENKGVSYARNTGLRNCSGECVTFVDSDDYVERNYISTLLYGMKGADLSVASSTGTACRDGKKIAAKTYEEMLFGKNYKVYGYQGYVHGKMFQKKIIEEHALSFDESIFYNEDRLFVFSYLKHISKVFYRDVLIYHYEQHDVNTSDSRGKTFHMPMLTELDAFEKMIRQIEPSEESFFYANKDLFYATLRLQRLVNRSTPEMKRIESLKKASYQVIAKSRYAKPIDLLKFAYRNKMGIFRK